MRNVLYALCCLVLIAGLIGCGNTQMTGPSVDSTQKTSRVSMSFSFPGSEDRSASVLSTTMTHILVEVFQLSVDGVGRIALINQDKAVASSSTPSVTLDLVPTYSVLCATQYKGDPNDTITSQRLDTTCSTGTLVAGVNNITLTMLRGTWTFSSPLLSTGFGNLPGVEAIAMTRPAGNAYFKDMADDHGVAWKGESDSGAIALGGDMDGMDNPFDMKYQCYGEKFCLYNMLFKTGGNWYSRTPSDYGAAAGFTMNMYDATDGNSTAFAFAAVREDPVLSATTQDYEPDWFEVFGFPFATNSNGWITQKVKTIMPVPTRAYWNWESAQRDCGDFEQQYLYWDGTNNQYLYICKDDRLFQIEMRAKLDKVASWAGNVPSYEATPATAAWFDSCTANMGSGTSISACVAKKGMMNVFSDADAFTHTHKVSAMAILQGANICYDDEGGIRRDDQTGEMYCMNFDMFYNGTGMQCDAPYVYVQEEGGCFTTKEMACKGDPSWDSYPDGTYDAATDTCVFGNNEEGYINDTSGSFAFGTTTLSGVGSLPSSYTISSQ